MITIHQFMEHLPSKAHPEALEGEHVNVQFDISGEQGGAYTVLIDDGKLNISEGLNGQSDCVISATDENLSKLLSRDINPMLAVLTGKIKKQSSCDAQIR